MFGVVLLAVVAIAVTAITYGALAAPATTLTSTATATFTVGGAVGTATATSAALTVAGTGGLLTGALGATAGAIAGGAIAGAAGAFVSQGVGVATGIQDRLNWKGIGLAALSGAVGGVFKAGNLFSDIGSGTVRAGVGGGAGSLATQGIAVATGLQDSFSWAGVAAAGVAAGANFAIADTLGTTPFAGRYGSAGIGNHLAHLGTRTASLLASAATRSALDGSSFSSSITAGLPDVIGQTLYGFAAHGVENPGRQITASPTSSGGYASLAQPGLGRSVGPGVLRL
ncbi:MAG: hypothetical protein AAGE92_17105, partial [Cyanobacteria bacterium P01_G01_bin.4]